jgi:hypothetical protein
MKDARLDLTFAAIACGALAYDCAARVPGDSGWIAVLSGVAAIGWVVLGLRVGRLALAPEGENNE